MTLRRRVIPALYNGVSQQPPLLRSPDQTEDELNTWATLAEGVGKRPPTEHLAFIANDLGPNPLVHYVNRDASERYVVVITQTGIKVYDHLTGLEKTVNAPDGYSYLTGGSFRAVTVADYTFIVNIDKSCALAALGVDAAYDPDYYRWLNNRQTDAFTFGDIGAFTDGSIRGSPFQYLPNSSAGVMSGEVASMEKLPETAADGTMYKVTGSVETGFVSFYVRRNGAVWDETVANGLNNALNATTMPHALVREADGTFTFAPFSWQNRRVGDENNNPPPTFVGRTIKDVFFYQNRLGFLVDENVVFSCSGDFGNFWRNTVLDYVVSDVVDVAVTTTSVSLLNFALPFGNGIMAFADQTQFSISNSAEGLTPESIAIRPVTSYEVNIKVRPVTIGTEVYYCGDQAGSSVVWEYTRGDDTDGLSAAEITAHVPHYLPSQLTKLIAAPNVKALFALTGGSEVYVYQFYWNGNEKAQSAWRKWDMGDPVIAGEYFDGHLYMLIQRPSGIMLERASLEANTKSPEQNYQVYLDRRCVMTGVYNPVSGRTTYTVPYTANQSRFRLIRSKFHPTAPGSLVNPATYQWTNATTVSVLGQETAAVTAGEGYLMRFEFSRQFPQDYQGRTVTTGRLQLRTFTLYYTNTGFFRTEVAPYGSAIVPDIEDIVPAKMADFTGKVVGSQDLILNSPSFQTGSYSFQVYGDASQCDIAISNDTHVGSTFVSAEWEGFYTSRAQ
jgi:hypothetical protein